MSAQGPVTDAYAESLASYERLFRMHVGDINASTDYDWLNSSEPNENPTLDYDGDTHLGITIRKQLPSQRWRHFWVLYPEVNTDVQILGNLSAHVWAASRDNESGSRMMVEFSDMNPVDWDNPSGWTPIGSASVSLLGPVFSSFKPYDLVISGVDYVLPRGHHLVLTIMRDDSLNDGLLVLYDDDYFDSYILMETPDFVSVDELVTADSEGVERTTFSDSEDVAVSANISNPYGAYEILGAEIQASYTENETVILAFTAMQLVGEDVSTENSWKLFDYVLQSLPESGITITVRALDPDGAPSWLTAQISIVAVDHFDVVAPAIVTVLEPFDMTVFALDEFDDVITEWVGTVSFEAYLEDGVTPAIGTLGIASTMLEPADAGEKTVSGQTLDYAEETILIRASSGSHFGWTSQIDVRGGPVVTVDISYEGRLEVAAGSSTTISVIGTDANGFVNSTWTPNWTLTGDLGTLSCDGLNVTFDAASSGSGFLNCTEDVTSASDSLEVIVNPSLLSTIVISPDGTLTIREGEEAVITAIGYDAYGNEVGIGGAMWSTNTSGTISGTGNTATYRAGFIPEVGVIEVSVGPVRALLEVVVTNALDGPWLTTIPMQVSTEDSDWTLVLSTYWHHVNGTSGLRWHAEGVNNSLYLVLHDTVSEAYVKFLTQPDKFGTDEFRLWVRDENGFSTYQDIIVNIQAVNDRPRFINEPPTELYVKFDTPYSFEYSYYIKDVDTDKADLRMFSSLPSNVYFDRLIGTFIFPEQDGKNSYFEMVAITVTDSPEGSTVDSTNSDNINIVVRVTDDSPPSLNGSLPDIVLYEGQMDVFAFDLDDYFYDIDNEYLVYTYGFENIDIYIDSDTHEVYISAPTEWSGTTEGTFTAIDPLGALKMDTLHVTVIAVNDPPCFESPGTVHVRYDYPHYLDASMYVSDPDHALEELTIVFNTPNVTYSGGDFVLLFPPSPSGAPFSEPYVVDVSGNVSDPSGACASIMFEVVVSDNYPPQVTTPSPYYDFVTFLEDGYLNNSMRLDVLFSDFDSPEGTLSYSVSGNENVVVMIYDSSVVNFTAAENWSGMESIEFRAVDAQGAWCSWRMTVIVIAVNDAPVAYRIPDYFLESGEGGAHFDISGYFFDSETPFSGLVIHAMPDPEVIVVGNYLYVDFPKGASRMTITLVAEDPDGAESNSVTFTVHLVEDWADKIGWPWTFLVTLMGAGIGGYFLARRIPRPFELEELFLIHNDGRLMSHVTREEGTGIDKDVVSAMFTAVQEFVRDSFQAGELGLKKLEIGDRNVMIEKGKYVYLALIYSGWPPQSVFQSLSMMLSDVEERYRGKIEHWNGTKKALPGVDEMLQKYMAREYEPGAWQPGEGILEDEWVDIISKEN